MTRNTKIFSGLAMGAILALTVTVASAHEGDKSHSVKQGHSMNKSHSMKSKRGHQGGHGIISLVKQLNLNDKQKESIKAIMKDSKTKHESKYMAFSGSSFDKSKYIKQMESAKDNRIKEHAQTIEKIYAILDKNQKLQLRVLMDLKEGKTK